MVVIDPDDNGNVSVVHGLLASLKAPLLLIGAEVAWRASSVCAPLANNYLRFFERAPAGTVELTLRDADHVQMLDEAKLPMRGLCRLSPKRFSSQPLFQRRALRFKHTEAVLHGQIDQLVAKYLGKINLTF